jgi:parvulin-like peptidyl-prolyl isomerase
MNQGSTPSPKMSRQQLRAQAREKREADGWIAALGARDPGMVRSIRTALGTRHVTRTELEEAIGMSLAGASPAPRSAPPEPRPEPERITVQHILISFAGAGTSASRTQEAAATLATETLERAEQGEDFGELVRAMTDDSFPGIYRLCNTGHSPESADEYRRGGMVPAFGDVGFTLDVGGISIAPFDPRASPYGWHIIKRLA